MTRFNPQLILPSYRAGVEHIFNIHHEVVMASHFAEANHETQDFHNKVVIGRLLSISTPNTSGMHLGRSLTIGARSSASAGVVGNGAKRSKIMSPVASFAFILIFGDQWGAPNCFALILNRKSDFQRQFGTDIARSELVRIGDVFAIKDPRPSDDQLGDTITILKEPKLIVGITSTGWTSQPLKKAMGANWQVYFDEPNKQIEVHGPTLLLPFNKTMTCNAYTCDRQNLLCKGCFGKSPTKKPIVLECDVVVRNTLQYSESSNTAKFERFTSFRFTTLFFNNIVGLSSMHDSVIRGMYNQIQESVLAMVHFVNINGGWSVTGWHKRGVITDDGTGDQILSIRTAGHLILLQPTDMSILDRPEFRAMKICEPNNNVLPTVPPANIPPPVPQNNANVNNAPPPPPRNNVPAPPNNTAPSAPSVDRPAGNASAQPPTAPTPVRPQQTPPAPTGGLTSRSHAATAGFTPTNEATESPQDHPVSIRGRAQKPKRK